MEEEKHHQLRMFVKLKETGIVSDKPKRERPKTVRTVENIAAVAESVSEASSISIHRRSQQLNISEWPLQSMAIVIGPC